MKKKNNKRGCATECDKCRPSNWKEMPLEIKNKYIEAQRKRREKKRKENPNRKYAGPFGGRHSLGRIRIINLITNEILIFKSTNDPNLLKIFDRSTISRHIKNGEPTKAGNRSKCKTPYIIERLSE